MLVLGISWSAGSGGGRSWADPARSGEGRTGSTGRGGGGGGFVSVAVITGCDEDFIKIKVLVELSVRGGARDISRQNGEFGAREDAIAVHLTERPLVCCADCVLVRGLVEAVMHVCERVQAWCEWKNAGRIVGVSSGKVERVDFEGVLLADYLDRCEDEDDCCCFIGDKVNLDTFVSAC